MLFRSGPTLGKGHQRWELNEINALIWPNASGIGLVPQSAVAQTVKIAKTYGVIKKTPSGATNYTYARQALAQLKGADTKGLHWKKAVVHVTPGGN